MHYNQALEQKNKKQETRTVIITIKKYRKLLKLFRKY